MQADKSPKDSKFVYLITIIRNMRKMDRLESQHPR